MTKPREIPTLCQLCGEQFPNPDAAWDHRCPEWGRVVRTNKPTLAAHRNIIRFYNSRPDGLFKRVIRRGILMAYGPDADLLDALVQCRRKKFAFRLSRKLVKRSLVKDVRTNPAKPRYRHMYETEYPGEEPF